ncbi:MAG: glycosyltransferase family A protein [bacterium]|nr:glycosyltransferase family A protein [bacterium]
MSSVSQEPVITTVLPTYRRPKLLRRAIRSVLNQTYPHFQVCVYDDASGDETAAVVAEMAQSDLRIKYYCHPENIGCDENYNYGAEHVETPFFSFLSDDDVLLPEFYETALEGFAKFPDAALSGGLTIGMTDKGKVGYGSVLGWERTGYYPPPDGFFPMVEKGHPVWTGVLFRTDPVKDIRPALDMEIGGGTDGYLLYRIALRFPIVISKKPCAIGVMHPSSATVERQSSPFRIKESLKSSKHLADKITEDEHIPSDVRIRVRQAFQESSKQKLLRCGLQLTKIKEFEEAYKVVDSLYNQHQMKGKAIFLYAVIKVCQIIPQAYYLGSCLNRIRRFFIIDKSFSIGLGKLQKEFGDYARFLKL